VLENDYWEHHLNESEIASWRGIAFEEVCFNHISQIKLALGISGVSTVESAMIVKGENNNEGMQLDLVIERNDDVVNLCELKCYKDIFVVDKAYNAVLLNRQSAMEKRFPHKSIHLTLITTNGVTENEYSSTFQSKIALDDLFAK